MNKILIIIGIVFAFGGVIFSLLPHDVHMSIFGGGEDMHMDDEEMGEHMETMEHHNHGVYVAWGLIIAIIGLGLIFAGWKIF